MLTSFYQLQATTRRNPFILSPLRRSTSSDGPTLRNMAKSHKPQRPFVFHCPVLDHHCSPFLLPFPAPLSCTPIPTSTSPHLTSCQVDAPLTSPTPLRHPRLTASKRGKAVSVQPTTWSSVLTIRRVLATLSRSSKTVQLSRWTPAPNIGHP
jgi:hypothetical protein